MRNAKVRLRRAGVREHPLAYFSMSSRLLILGGVNASQAGPVHLVERTMSAEEYFGHWPLCIKCMRVQSLDPAAGNQLS